MSQTLREKEGRYFYKDYALSNYQYEMLTHLLTEESPSFTVIPDWENLFVVTLLYAQAMTANATLPGKKDQKVVIYSRWPVEDIENVIRDVPEFYELYQNVIVNSVLIIHVQYGRLEEARDGYSIGMGTSDQIRLGASRYDKKTKTHKQKMLRPRLVLTCKTKFADFTRIHPAYVQEQMHPVWVTIGAQNYVMTEKPFHVSKPIGKNTLLECNYFTIDDAFENVYALYSLLARCGDGQKMLQNYVTYPTDYGPGGYNEGHYLLPYKFYLELPAWIPLLNQSIKRISPGLSCLELMLLTHQINLPTVTDTSLTFNVCYTRVEGIKNAFYRKSESKRIEEYALESCGKFDLQLGYESSLIYRVSNDQEINYWAWINPASSLGDTLLVSDNLARIP